MSPESFPNRRRRLNPLVRDGNSEGVNLRPFELQPIPLASKKAFLLPSDELSRSNWRRSGTEVVREIRRLACR